MLPALVEAYVIPTTRADVVSWVLRALAPARWVPLVFLASASAACAGTVAGGGDLTDADLARARAEAAPGARTFAGECARCHGARGEGLAGVPSVLGAGALPEYPRELATAGAPGLRDPAQMEIDRQTEHTGLARRGPFRSADDLYAFVRRHVRRPRTGVLRADDYAVLVGFMIAAQGGELPPGGLTIDNARSIPIPRR